MENHVVLDVNVELLFEAGKTYKKFVLRPGQTYQGKVESQELESLVNYLYLQYLVKNFHNEAVGMYRGKTIKDVIPLSVKYHILTDQN